MVFNFICTCLKSAKESHCFCQETFVVHRKSVKSSKTVKLFSRSTFVAYGMFTKMFPLTILTIISETALFLRVLLQSDLLCPGACVVSVA